MNMLEKIIELVDGSWVQTHIYAQDLELAFLSYMQEKYIGRTNSEFVSFACKMLDKEY